MDSKECVEILKEMEKESCNEKDLKSGKIIYNAPAIFSYERDYKQALSFAIKVLENLETLKTNAKKYHTLTGLNKLLEDLTQ